MKFKKPLLISLLVVLTLGGGYVGFTRYALHRLREGLQAAELALKDKGFTVAYTHLDIYGSLFTFHVILKDLHLKNALVDWQGEDVHLSMHPWAWHRMNYTLHGQQYLKIEGSPPLAAEKAHGHFTWTSNQTLDQLTLQADLLHLPKPFDLKDITLRAKNLAQLLAAQIDLTFTLLGLPDPITCTLDAHLSGFQKDKAFPQTLAQWRDGGGVLDINLFRLVWQPLDIVGEGTLTFDGDMFPLGSFSTRITGFQDGLKHLVKAGFVKDKNAAMAGFVLSLLARDVQGEKQIHVPLTLQDKHLSLGSVPLMKLEGYVPLRSK